MSKLTKEANRTDGLTLIIENLRFLSEIFNLLLVKKLVALQILRLINLPS